jgi:hypothetical protein
LESIAEADEPQGRRIRMSVDKTHDGKSNIYEVYNSLREFEENHNNVQAGIRGLASVWLLSSLGAIAYLLRVGNNSASFVIAADFGVSVVCLLGAIGLSVLWSLDQLVYQSFLNAIFILALKMEYDDNTLPPIRTLESLNASHGRGIGPKIRIFYFAPMYVLAAISVLLLFTTVGNQGKFSGAQPAIAAGTIIVILIARLAAYRYRQAPKDRAPDFCDQHFTAYIDTLKHSARTTLQRYSPDGPKMPR